MATSKKIIEEMKKYNKELDKHIPGLDDESLNSNSVFKTDDDQDEVFTLFAQNLLDLRTEMNLIRKNLSTDIEGMVTRVVNEQQRKFNARMDNFFVKAILDVKENWSEQLNTFAKEINEIKRGFNQMKTETSNFEDTLTELKEQLMLLKSVMSTISNKDDSSILIPQIKSLENKVDEIRDDMESDSDSNTQMQQKLSKLSNSYKALLLKFNDIKVQTDTIDTEVANLKGKNTRNLKKNLETEFNSKFEDLEGSYDKLLSELNDLKGMAHETKEKMQPKVDMEEDLLRSLSEKPDIEIMKNTEDVKDTVNKTPSDKIIDIESKISKLSSFK